MVPFTKFRDFSQAIFDPAGEVVPVRLCRTQFTLVMFSDLGSSLRQFGLEARPYVLLVVIVLLREQSEGFCGTTSLGGIQSGGRRLHMNFRRL